MTASPSVRCCLPKRFWDNRFLLGAFAVGVMLLGAVLTIPPLEPLFQVAALSMGQVGIIVGLSLGSMLVIQLLKLSARKTFVKSEIFRRPEDFLRPGRFSFPFCGFCV